MSQKQRRASTGGEMGLHFFRDAEKEITKTPADYNLFKIAEHLYSNLRDQGLLKDGEEERKNFFEKFHARLLELEPDKNPELDKHISDFFEKHGKNIRRIALWSQGDVLGTGYQEFKIFKSGLLKDFAQSEISKKYDALIEQDKVAVLPAYLTKLGKMLKEKNLRVVIVDDEPKNFERAAAVIKESKAVFKRNGINVELSPIWAAYGRRVEKLKREDAERYENLCKAYDHVENFGELSTKPEFEERFKGSVVLLDVDGVMLNNKRAGEAMGQILHDLAKEYTGDNESKLEKILTIKER